MLNLSIAPDPGEAALVPQARAVAEAQAKQQRAAQQLEAATAELVTADARIDELSAERAGIIGRRARGVNEPDDAGRLALLAADLEALAGIKTEAAARVEAARPPQQLADTILSNACVQLERAENEQMHAALLAYLERLDAAMLAGLRELASVQHALGTAGRPAWGPTRELAQALRKVQAIRNEL